MSKNSKPLPQIVEQGDKIRLQDLATDLADLPYDKKSACKKIAENAVIMADHARRLYAENKRSILLVLQGMDTAGKDGTIRTVMRGMNPRSCQVRSFKKPSEEELDHDFLWRVHGVVPRKGNIGIFNRSHYEDVLVVRVHSLVPENRWKKRYELINDFEHLLYASGTIILKCFLHISKETQRERLQARIDKPEKHWKFNPADLEERKLWDHYQAAYEDVLNKCSTKHAPWYVVPSDRKWVRNLVVSELVLKTIKEMKPAYPESRTDFRGLVVE